MTTPRARSDPELSVVIPAYRSWATLPLVLDALKGEIAGRDREVVLVESSGELDVGEIARRWPWVRAIGLPERAFPGRARNVGVGAARGSRIAFIDSDAIPVQGWLDELQGALRPGIDAVGGGVVNGTPRSAIGTADFLLALSEWLPARRKPLEHAATCNLLIRREAFERVGGFREDLEAAEDTLLTFRISRGGRLGFAPSARVAHLNHTKLVDFLSHQRLHGAGFAAICSIVDFPHAWVARRRGAAALTPFLRLATVSWRLRQDPRLLAASIFLSPLLLLGTCAWAVGLSAGQRQWRRRLAEI